MLKSVQEMLEYGFDVLNEVYFENSLPPIVITLMSSPRTNGHYTINREWRCNQDRLNEINISVEHIDRPIENIMATLCHEMVHYHCALHDIADTSQSGRYHNKNFKREAEKRGLLISYEQGIGWSHTEPSEEFIETIRQHGIEKPLDINRDGHRLNVGGVNGISVVTIGINGIPGADGDKPKPKSSTRKYVCPCCGNSFRATKDINVLCLDCVEQYVKVEK